MGTSNMYGGPHNNTPLVPSWLDENENSINSEDHGGTQLDDNEHPEVPPPLPDRPPPVTPRFTEARKNFSRFSGSGGRDRASLGRSISYYVSRSAGGARQGAQRMGSSLHAGGQLLHFLWDVQTRGAHKALQDLDIDKLVGRPIEEIFLALADVICPEGGQVDEGIARNAFIETIVALTNSHITDLDELTADQIQTVFELYATHAIEARICNDIGMKMITLPVDVRAVEQVQCQLRDFVRRAVSDGLNASRAAAPVLTRDQGLAFVTEVCETTFEMLRLLGDLEATG